MKFGMTSLTFRNKSIEETLKIAKKAGIDGIEWGVAESHVSSDSSIDEIKKLSSEYGIEIFSLGSYCYLEEEEHCMETVNVAKKLSAPVIRVWAGKKSPCDCDDDYFNTIVKNTQKMADEAAKYGIAIGFEYHARSLTETAESAVKLIKAINRENVKTYWQPSDAVSLAENLSNLKTVAPYFAGIFHIQNYNAADGYGLISDIKDKVKNYFEEFKDTDSNLLIEFVKDGSEENFLSDVKTLKELF